MASDSSAAAGAGAVLASGHREKACLAGAQVLGSPWNQDAIHRLRFGWEE